VFSGIREDDLSVSMYKILSENLCTCTLDFFGLSAQHLVVSAAQSILSVSTDLSLTRPKS